MTARISVLSLLRALLAVLTAGVVTLVLHPGAGTGASSRAVTVAMGEYYYRPAPVTIRVGDRVRFVNKGRIDHTVADVDRRGVVRSKVIKPRLLASGDAQVVRFQKVGTIRYLCTLHPTRMKGAVIVSG